ncbi:MULTISPECIES: hypothetical protein [Pseudoalteromonas]|uniref:Uncharacterized protein n=1 Tax=Pseudoalteromonas amylolytica TaxID=1859457 RepID=A0A1S1MNA5_9GAMM|nr:MULTISPECIES: hypothetical protein [Pseudoalteromonas]OHU84339.1 hypothetical protein BFC16_01495 [Pseudoalteromonas sp. JW3]OHU87122.1 hypothetical protein BET10_00445 [Pseudoalteromonas amylolytica]
MRNLITILMICTLSACQAISSSVGHVNFVGPSNSKQSEFAPLTTLVTAHQSACDNGTAKQLVGYRAYLQLNEFLQAFCSTRSTTTQLRLIAQLHQQNDWPQDYLSYFAMLHQHITTLRQYKLENIALKKQLTEQQNALHSVELALSNLKQKLAQIEQQRLLSPSHTDTETDSNPLGEQQ